MHAKCAILMTSLNFGTQLAEHASEHMTAARLMDDIVGQIVDRLAEIDGSRVGRWQAEPTRPEAPLRRCRR